MKELIQEKCRGNNCRSSARVSFCRPSEAGSVILLYTTGVVLEVESVLACLAWRAGCGELVGERWSFEPGNNVGDKAELPVLYVRGICGHHQIRAE